MFLRLKSNESENPETIKPTYHRSTNQANTKYVGEREQNTQKYNNNMCNRIYKFEEYIKLRILDFRYEF